MAQWPAQKTVKRRRAANDQQYWRKRLFHRWYAEAGKRVVVPDWYVRIRYAGHRDTFNLETGNEDMASKKARDIYQMIVAEGWEAALARFKPKPKAEKGLTLREYASIYREVVASLQTPPSKPTYERYISSLLFIGAQLQVDNLADLTMERIETFQRDYLAKGRSEGRAENSVKTTINFHLRNAGALFSKQVTEAMRGRGVSVSNPFAGSKLRRVHVKPYSPLKRELVDAIWRSAQRLRDGNPKADPPKRRKGGRWQPPDFRQPHPDSYVVLLLELGLGFRRNEADKAEWEWFIKADGRDCIEVRESRYFKPKPKQRRVVPVERILFEAIQATRSHAGAWIVPSPAPKLYPPGREPKRIVYRCDKAHRALAAWLRELGVDDGKPCHVLRKEFGSYVATSFGLFHAQKVLGHSSPVVTADYYAALTCQRQLLFTVSDN